MKLLLTTIKTDRPSTDLALEYMYSIVADAPIETQLHTFGDCESNSEIYEYIFAGQYDVVYFHIDEMNEIRVGHICEMIKQAMPSTIIVVGGIQVSFDTHKFMEYNPCVDFVIRGEGETVMFNFIKNLITQAYDFAGIQGLAYRSDNGIVVNEYDTAIPVDSLPFPYDKITLEDKELVYYSTIRGTSDRAVYNQFLPDARVRALSSERVCTELKYFLVQEVEKIVFLDQWFNFSSERAYRIFEYIISNDNGITTFEMNIDGDNLDEDTIRLLAEAREGLFIFNIDVASTNAETLATVGRNENIYQLMYNVTKLLQSCRIKTNLAVTAGLPLETEQLFARSFNKVYGLGNGTSLNINIVKLPKGCMLRNDAAKYGYIYTRVAPYEVLGNAFLSAGEMISIKAMSKVLDAYIGELFSRAVPRILTDTAMKPYDFFMGLTAFIAEKEITACTTEDKFRVINAYAAKLYDEASDELKHQQLTELLNEDLKTALSEEELQNFEREGWDIA